MIGLTGHLGQTFPTWIKNPNVFKIFKFLKINILSFYIRVKHKLTVL